MVDFLLPPMKHIDVINVMPNVQFVFARAYAQMLVPTVGCLKKQTGGKEGDTFV